MLNRSRLHVGDLAPEVTEIDLRDLFARVGEVADVTLPMNSDTSTHNGFAFVEMMTGEGARDAVKQLNGFVFHGRPLFVYAVPPKSTRRGESKAELH
jgi:RNA recognition motif-containing protein